MPAVRRNCSIAFVILFLTFQFVKSQYTPPVPCPDVFKYVKEGDNYSGLVILSIPLQSTDIVVELSQREPITTSFNGRLSLTTDLPSTQKLIESGQPVSYRIDFPNPHILPKLVSISMNGITVCQGQKYAPPSTTFKVFHSFYPAYHPNNNMIPIGTYALAPTTTVILSNSSQQSEMPKDYTKYKQLFQQIVGQSPTAIYEIPLTNPSPNRNSASAPNRNFLHLQSQPILTRETTNFLSTTSPLQPSQNVACGREGLQPFIAGGHDFPRGKFPWLAAIYLRDSVNLKFTCGGSLISSRTVITAAHCFPSTTFEANQVSVYLGRHNLFVSEEGSEQRDISNLIIHPNYNMSKMSDADLALLELSTPVSFNVYIRPICLWSQSSEIALIENYTAFIAGWGSDNNGNSFTSSAKMVESRIVSEAECLRSSDLFRILTSSRSLCAGNRDGTGPCIGDSGGGLMMEVFGVWTLRGIVSVGPVLPAGKTAQRQCDLNQFVVYSDVAKHLTWIRRNMIS